MSRKPYNVELLSSYSNAKIRSVCVPDAINMDESLSVAERLEKIFHYGQNDFQPLAGICSVSSGDVIHLDGKRYLILLVGFCELDEDEYNKYLATNRLDRVFFAWDKEPTVV